MVKRLSILGSTGSIGRNALLVAENYTDDLQIVYLTANKNSELLIRQALKFRPEGVVIVAESQAKEVEDSLKKEGMEVLTGREGLLEVAKRDNIDLVLNGIVGGAGMEPTLNAVKAGNNVALSNKESLVMAGDLITGARRKSGAEIYPVDSEHSAIWQCLQGEDPGEVRKLILTGSGGPFRTRGLDSFAAVKPEEALKHPNWDMGAKITIDSATMMNKGLEVIEAYWLFNIPPEKIEIVVHPQSIIHSMVEFQDGSVKAQLGVPDMKIPIQYALFYPKHKFAEWESLDWNKVRKLTFEKVDLMRFPSIQLAYAALERGGSAPAVLNVANDTAVYRFLRGEIRFTDIPMIVEEACAEHTWKEHLNLDDLLDLESWAKAFVKSRQVPNR
ncbi:MAG: 1-deoxy-D-xylulose-5-phosphate reductoisomerase [Candidatus Neomarinimicrobiota bacterium]